MNYLLLDSYGMCNVVHIYEDKHKDHVLGNKETRENYSKEIDHNENNVGIERCKIDNGLNMINEHMIIHIVLNHV